MQSVLCWMRYVTNDLVFSICLGILSHHLAKPKGRICDRRFLSLEVLFANLITNLKAMFCVLFVFSVRIFSKYRCTWFLKIVPHLFWMFWTWAETTHTSKVLQVTNEMITDVIIIHQNKWHRTVRTFHLQKRWGSRFILLNH